MEPSIFHNTCCELIIDFTIIHPPRDVLYIVNELDLQELDYNKARLKFTVHINRTHYPFSA